jgi:hypothetical protein
VGARFSAPVQTGLGAHSASCTMSTGSFPVVKSGRGVTLTPHSFLVPWSRKSRAIPVLPLWAVRSVQSLCACTWVRFTLPFTAIGNNNVVDKRNYEVGTTSATIKFHKMMYGKDTYVVCDSGSSAEHCNKHSGFTFPSNYQILQIKSALWSYVQFVRF